MILLFVRVDDLHHALGLTFAIEYNREAQACTHKPVLVAEAALLQGREHRPRGAPGLSAGTSRADGGDCNRGTGNGNVDSRGRPDVAAGACPAATLYGPDNKYRLNVREPSRMTAELRAREREQGEKVRNGHNQVRP